MKKILATIILVYLGMMVLAAPALAATTISLSPSNIAVTQGQNFNVAVKIDPHDIKNYTAKIQIQYPADLLEAKSFAFGSGWMALSQPGYDLIDNAKGIVIKTAGYPGGFSKAVTFGTVSFLAKKTGNGIIKIGSESIVLDKTNHNVFEDTAAQSSITITTSLSPQEQALPPGEETLLIPEKTVTPSSSAPALFDILTQQIIRQSQGNLLIPILVGVGILIIVVAGYLVYRKRKREIE